MDNFLKQLHKLRHGIVFDAEKKARVRSQLTSYMRGGAAVRNSEALRRSMQRSIPTNASLMSMKLFRFAVPVMAIVFLGAGTSFAAEGALPGQPLYAVKTGVNEKLAAAFTFSADAKANLDASLAARRLAEANELAAQGKLNAAFAAQIKESFENSADRAESRI